MTKREYADRCEQLTKELIAEREVVAKLNAQVRFLKKLVSQNAEESAKNTAIILELCEDETVRDKIVRRALDSATWPSLERFITEKGR